MNTIRQLCDRCIVLDKGKIIFSGGVEEAIELYMGKAIDCPKRVDLAKAARPHHKCKDGIKLTAAEIVNADEWRIKVGDKLRYNITVKATKDMENVCFKTRVMTADENSVSLFLAPNLITCKAGEEIEIPLEADTSQLVPGKYLLTPALYDINEFGEMMFFDHVHASIGLEVETKLGFCSNMKWDQRWWGNIKLPDIVDLRK